MRCAHASPAHPQASSSLCPRGSGHPRARYRVCWTTLDNTRLQEKRLGEAGSGRTPLGEGLLGKGCVTPASPSWAALIPSREAHVWSRKTIPERPQGPTAVPQGLQEHGHSAQSQGVLAQVQSLQRLVAHEGRCQLPTVQRGEGAPPEPVEGRELLTYWNPVCRPVHTLSRVPAGSKWGR